MGDERFRESGDYWKLTRNGKLLYDGKAAVVDEKTGKVIVSADQMGVNDDDYIGAIAAMFGVSPSEAARIISTSGAIPKSMAQVNNVGIQIQGGNATFQDYSRAIQDMVKYGRGPAGNYPLEHGFLTYDGENAKLFNNFEVLIGGDRNNRISTLGLSRIGRDYTNQEWDSLLSSEMSPGRLAASAGRTQVTFDMLMDDLKENGRVGDPQYTETCMQLFFGNRAFTDQMSIAAFCFDAPIGGSAPEYSAEGRAYNYNMSLPDNLEFGSMTSEAARRWYKTQEKLIPGNIGPNQILSDQAKDAFLLRNNARGWARELMADRTAANKLWATEPMMTWEQAITKYSQRGFSGDGLWQQIIRASQRSRASVDANYLNKRK
jgi:hypothetical protein